jgi:uncharacterized damage-inducible protein DinB
MITMSLNQPLIAELQQEAAKTRKILERVPVDRGEWKPHFKSMKLGKLAMHVAEITGWVAMTMLTDELDLAQFDYKLKSPESVEDLLAKHDEHVEQAVAVLENCKDEDFDKLWTMRRGDHVIMSMPRSAALRTFAYSHLFHHRAQLGVYLRMLDVPIPGMYGPTADELEAMAAGK